MNRMRMIAFTAMITVSGCGESVSVPSSFELREVMRYGRSGMPSDSSAVAPDEDGSGVLADIAGVVRDSSGTVYVLDRDWKRIVAFAQDGTVEEVIGSPGEGPGEFRLPLNLTSGPRGVLSVLDYELSRVTWFREHETSETVSLPISNVRGHVAFRDSVWVTSSSGGASDRPIVYRFSMTGEVLGEGPALVNEDQAFGAPIGISRGNDSSVLVSTMRPGVWMEFREGSWSRVGQPLFPQMDPPTEEVVEPRVTRVTPAQAMAAGIGLIGDSIVVQGYGRFPEPFSWEDPPRREDLQHFLGLYSRDGILLDTIALPSGFETFPLYVAPETGHLFLISLNPFPQVVEFCLGVGRDCV